MAPNDSFTLKNEAAGSSESFVPIYQSTWRHIPEDRKLVYTQKYMGMPKGMCCTVINFVVKTEFQKSSNKVWFMCGTNPRDAERGCKCVRSTLGHSVIFKVEVGFCVAVTFFIAVAWKWQNLFPHFVLFHLQPFYSTRFSSIIFLLYFFFLVFN
jgi:hypothetical protein